MKTKIAWVKQVNEDRAVLSLGTGEKCSHCGTKMYYSAKDENIGEFDIPNTLGARNGDQVEITYHESSRIFSAFLIFIAPILFLIAGYVFGYIQSDSELIGAVGATIGLIIGSVILILLDRILARNKEFMPKMVRIVPGNQDQRNSSYRCKKKLKVLNNLY